jgi:8-oxo-dGTP pyrophosphatase MutT (NUDIX family)
MYMNHDVLYNKELFLEQTIERLGTNPIDYAEKLEVAGQKGQIIDHQLKAGVLLLLSFCENNTPDKGGEGELFFRLIKRSRHIAQAGDLACPGGMLYPKWDLPIKKLITSGFMPLLKNKAGRCVRRRDRRTFHAITLFLANAAREAWEEIRLNPFRMLFLGPLPSCSLHVFPRTIFPLVGFVNGGLSFRPGYEVERIVDIPVRIFFQQENYGTLTTVRDNDPHRSVNSAETLPCLRYRDPEGRENILWGATFLVVASFLKIVFDFQIPKGQPGLTFNKILDARYLSGEQ